MRHQLLQFWKWDCTCKWKYCWRNWILCSSSNGWSDRVSCINLGSNYCPQTNGPSGTANPSGASGLFQTMPGWGSTALQLMIKSKQLIMRDKWPRDFQLGDAKRGGNPAFILFLSWQVREKSCKKNFDSIRQPWWPMCSLTQAWFYTKKEVYNFVNLFYQLKWVSKSGENLWWYQDFPLNWFRGQNPSLTLVYECQWFSSNDIKLVSPNDISLIFWNFLDQQYAEWYQLCAWIRDRTINPFKVITNS